MVEGVMPLSDLAMAVTEISFPSRELVLRNPTWNQHAQASFEVNFLKTRLVERRNGLPVYVFTQRYRTSEYIEVPKAPRLGKTWWGHIPSDLVPETFAISAIGIASLLGMVLSGLFFAVSYTLFLAPLITTGVGAVFLWQAMRRRS